MRNFKGPDMLHSESGQTLIFAAVIFSTLMGIMGVHKRPNEMVKPQHLHFLFYMDPTGNDSVFNGASAQDFYGAFYAPGTNLQVTGAGKGSGGPPWVTGQIVVSTVNWGGNSTSDISYRPCGPGATPCGSGTGTQLVQ